MVLMSGSDNGDDDGDVNHCLVEDIETSQELRMLSSVTPNCQVTKIVKKSSSQLSEM